MYSPSLFLSPLSLFSVSNYSSVWQILGRTESEGGSSDLSLGSLACVRSAELAKLSCAWLYGMERERERGERKGEWKERVCMRVSERKRRQGEKRRKERKRRQNKNGYTWFTLFTCTILKLSTLSCSGWLVPLLQTSTRGLAIYPHPLLTAWLQDQKNQKYSITSQVIRYTKGCASNKIIKQNIYNNYVHVYTFIC